MAELGDTTSPDQGLPRRRRMPARHQSAASEERSGTNAAALPETVLYAPHGLEDGIAVLASEPVFASILADAGPPRFRRRRNGFATLLHIILEQQVSIDAAAAMHRRLSETCRPLTPEGFLDLDEATLRACGFSRQKAGYARALATRVAAGDFDFDRLAAADDAATQAELLSLRGIGRWSADVYMLFALGRADIWPAADLGLQLGIAERLGLPARPDEPEVRRLGEAWQPWRSVAACLFWQAYLHKRRRSPPILAAELYA
jgi:DNA-3-methyladenine glycosylase II